MRELRLALVCYGGVSLAIYMHGLTKEIHKLVRASKALEEDSEHNPFPRDDTSRTYWKLLKELGAESAVRVVVDVIAGTSAGGINGVVLAKALAHDLDQEKLRSVWVDEAGLWKMRRWPRLRWPSFDKTGPRGSLLDGNHMLDLILGVLRDMDASGKPGTTLMPEGHQLDLFVTSTDHDGVRVWLPLLDPARDPRRFGSRLYQRGFDLRHDHVMHFCWSPGISNTRDFLDNPALTFAARATSSFPAAFAPLKLEDVRGALERGDPSALDPWPGQEAFSRRFFRLHHLEGADPSTSNFIDGGVLNNKPFEPVLAAVDERPAGHEVVRRVLYLEPDPQPVESPGEGRVGPFKTAASALHRLPAHEPIIQNLIEIGTRNARVAMLRSVIDSHREQVDALLGQIGVSFAGPFGLEDIGRWRQTVNAEAARRTGIAYPAYARLKIEGVVDQFATVVNRILDYPEDSSHGLFVREVVRLWAERRGLTRVGGLDLSDAQRSFLDAFDLGYRRRRIRFVIDGLNEYYAGVPPAPEGLARRGGLDTVKQRLYEQESELVRQIGGHSVPDGLGEALSRIFDADRIRAEVRSNEASPERYLDASSAELDALARRLEEELAARIPAVHAEVERTFLMLSDLSWPEQERDDLLTRYLGFPLWDALVFPVRHLGDVGELSQVRVVRVSPEDARALDASGRDKVKGAGLGHFKAFLKRGYRENDYLWGRLDGAERLVDIVVEAVSSASPPEVNERFKRDAFRRVLDAEAPNLRKTQELISKLRERIPADPSV